MRNGDFSELLANRGSNLNSIPQLQDPAGLSRRRRAGAEQRHAAVHDADRPVLRRPVPAIRTSTIPTTSTTTSTAALEPTNRWDFKTRVRLEHQQQHEGLRPHRAGEGNGREPARRVVGARPTSSRCRRRTSARTAAARYAGNVVIGAQPVDDQRSAGQLQPADARQPVRRIPRCSSRAPAASRSTASSPPAPSSPYLPTDLLHGWGSNGQVGNLWAKANDVYAHNDTLQFSNKLTKLAGAHGLKFGIAVERGQKQQNFQNLEAGQLWFGSDNNDRHRQLRRRHAGRARSASSTQGTAANGNPSPGQPFGEFRYWNIDAFAQDSWKLALEPHARVRRALRLLDEQRGTVRPRAATSIPTLYDPTKGSFLDPGTFQRVNGECYVETGCAPPAILDNRSPFALPRVNVAWDIDGEGNNVLRGGYGIFYNRNMGNVEYDNTLRLAPNAYQVGHGFLGRRQLRQRRGPDLRHDQRGDAGQPHRQPGDQLADAGLVHVPEDAQLQPALRNGASRGTRSSRSATSARAAGTWSAAATATSCRTAS